ncbi:MAG TPA: UDP-N-acetylmuramoyl-L-alanyl-D-glutamate--2,6-diaminopimelate ligase [Ignavibacteriaceae bacterium]|nr:UDP-N-acetylmuramoyl-L-alanyl-D-glutamate--2,6-diaminopimelate ligase [Ignavibacteriaceae bacterium]
MELTRLINSILTIQVSGNVQRKDILGITLDSRKASRNWIFVAIKGQKTDGHNYIADALNQGVCAVICEEENIPVELFLHANAVRILVKDSRLALAQLSNVYYGNFSEKINLIGVTGTNGKTTTTYYLKSILEKAGNKTGLIGTIANFIGSEKIGATFTTPESPELNKLLQKMALAGCGHIVMEVSSHALESKRVFGQRFSSALFTNITPEHLDYHGDFENYIQAKKILFDNLETNKIAVVNADDPNHEKIISGCKCKIVKFGQSDKSEYQIREITVNLDGTSFEIFHNQKSYSLHTDLIGRFNAYNATGAFAVALESGIDPEIIIQGIRITPQVPGRFEVVRGINKYAVIDYSHTPDSLEKAINNLRLLSQGKELITIVGCGGDRDKAKRPVMGKIASELSDKVILTNDNPRSEDPFAIIDQMKEGINRDNFIIETNRRKAIKTAIMESPDNSVILIAGKGHEDYQIIGNVRNHFSDKETAEEFLVGGDK